MAVISETPCRPWRATAARIVEELFPVTPEKEWNDLLDLRGLLLRGSDWGEVLESFSRCRLRMEMDHYLPFYRLRRLLSSHLRLENADSGASLEKLLRSRKFGKRRCPEARGRLRLVEQA